MRNLCPPLVATFLAARAAAGSPVVVGEPSQDRWMYPSNSTPGTRAQASTFSALPGASGFDDRWGFFLFAFDTEAVLPAGLPLSAYRIKSVKVRATIGQNELFRYDPTDDPWQSHGTPTVPAAVEDDDAGRPLELHGAGFRSPWTSSTFLETSSYGSSIPGGRNAYPLGFDPQGAPRDVSNNVTGQFEAIPWAVGKTSALAAGDPVPIDTAFTFTLDLSLPGVADYLKQGLAAGRVWFSLTSLHPAIQQGGEFVAWYTRDDVYHQFAGGLAPSLEIDAELAVRLSIGRSGNQITLSWPEFAGFTHTLESSTSLAPGSWAPVISHVAAAPGTGTHVEGVSTGARFYRIAITRTP